MLAVPVNFEKLTYPVLATPKLDGIRCLKVNDQVVSRTFKPIPNHHIRKLIEENLPNGVDGELISGVTFQESTSAVMTRDGTPTFTYMIFDYVSRGIEQPYNHRMLYLAEMYSGLPETVKSWVEILIPERIENYDQLLDYEYKCLEEGYEGIILRSPSSPYKCGRSTVKEGYLLKVKRFEDSEATVIGFEELMHNANELKEDALGYADRSTCKENMQGMNTLGSLKVMDINTNQVFNLGTGFTADQRREIWTNKDQYLGKITTYKFQSHGVKDLPRCPVFKGFRDPIDVGDV